MGYFLPERLNPGGGRVDGTLMGRSRLATVLVTGVLLTMLGAGPASARLRSPDWAKPAARYLIDQGWIEKADFYGNQAMKRKAFRRLMTKAFGGGYRRTKGKVTAGEVSAALVKALGRKALADDLRAVTSPDGWDPEVGKRFGTEIVARELGLRHDRPTSEEKRESSASQPMRQADVAWAVWKAKTGPSTWSADVLSDFGLAEYGSKRRKVVRFAMSLVGTPYVWGGEWLHRTPYGYPYGAQPAGGFDCSGFIWYVLQKKSSSYSPVNRGYGGWSIPERSSSQMAKATPVSERRGYKKLKPGDLVFFAPGGRGEAKPRDVYHAGLYLGRGWMIHSSGSRAGISLAPIGPGSWWRDQLMWGRRIID